MGRGIQGAILTAFGSRVQRIRVEGTRYLTDHVVVITFSSSRLLREVEHPGTFIRGWFPDPAKPGSLQQRGYTILDPDPATGRFDVAFLLHDPAGPASTWARTAQVGDEISAQRLSSEGGYDPEEHAGDGHLLVGDAAAWPAIRSIVAALPRDVPVRVLFEVHDPRDRELALPEHPRLEVIHVPARADSRALVDALAGQDLRGWHCWVTAESTPTRLVRNTLKLEHEQNKATMHTQAYWVAGRAMGTEVSAQERSAAAGAGAESGADPGGSATATASPASDPDRAGSSPDRTLANAAPDAPAPDAPPDAAAPHAAPPAGPDPGAAHVLRPARPAMIVAGIVQALLAALSVVPLILFAEVGRLFATGAEGERIQHVIVVALIVLAAGALGTIALSAGLHAHDVHYAAALRRRVLTQLSRLPLGWFTDRGSAEIVRLVRTDVGSLHYLVTHAVPDLVGAAVVPLVILGYLFSVDWLLALILLVPVIAYVVIMFRVAAADRPSMTRILSHDAVLRADLQRYLEGQPVSRVFGDAATVDLPAEITDMHTTVAAAQRRSIGVKSVALRLNRPAAALVLLTLAGTVLVCLGWTEPTTLIPFLVLGTSFADRLVAISYAGTALGDGLTARGELELLLTTTPLGGAAGRPAARGEHPEGEDGVDPVTTAADGAACAELDGVDFGYVPGRQVLHDIGLELVPGGVTALVGASGSGKSTVAALMARFWDPDHGELRLDGIDIRRLPEDRYREQLATVLQDARLVRGTLRENLTLARPDAETDEVEKVVDAACLREVVEALPAGLDTPMDRGSLSGGQRQRVAIARALLGHTRLVVLDEATAAADPDSEWEIQRGLDRLLRGRTVLVISHRLHTVVGADRIVVLEGGRIVETGTHTELVAEAGHYARMTRESEVRTR